MQWAVTEEWKGLSAFIVGGGSSLSRFDFDWLKDRKTIGCNHAYHLGPEIIDICIFGDAAFFHRNYVQLEKFGGRCVGVSPSLEPLKYSWLLNLKRIRDGLHNGGFLGWNYSTGAAAINLAYNLGANPIYLLGFDMRAGNAGKTHWHNHGRGPTQENSFRRFSRGFHTLAASLRHKDVEVFNVGDGTSALECFPKITFEQMKEREEEVMA